MKNELMTKVTRTFNKVTFQVKKHSPEILIVAGVVGTVASAVMACKATTKISGIINEAKSDIDNIHNAMNNEKLAAEGRYSHEDGVKDLTIVYAQTGIKLIKLYGPSVALGALSLTSIITSNHILRKRNVALAAAYTAVDKGFKEYRSRVVDRFGEEIDRQLRYNLKAKNVEETVVDEQTGEEKTVVKTIKNYADPNEPSVYARFFGEYTRDERGNTVKNFYWKRQNEYNLLFLKSRQNYANDLLKAKGRVFLNEVYDMLGLPPSKAGQVVGWVYDPENPSGDNYIDFGLYNFTDNYDDFIYGDNEEILLDFNVDGNAWESM